MFSDKTVVIILCDHQLSLINQMLPFQGHVDFYANYTINCVKTNCHLNKITLIFYRDFKQTDAAAANKQFPVQKDSRPNEFTRPLTRNGEN